MNPSYFLLLAASLGLTACGSIVILDDPGKPSNPPDTSGMPVGDPWTAPDGVAAPLPANGSSPGLPSTSDPTGAGWSGWWVRFPSFGVSAASIATLEGDAIVAVAGRAGDIDLGSGVLAPDLDPDLTIGVLIRVSAAGKLLWSRRVDDTTHPQIIVDATSRIHLAMPHGFRTYDAGGQILGERTFGEGVTLHGMAPTAERERRDRCCHVRAALRLDAWLLCTFSRPGARWRLHPCGRRRRRRVSRRLHEGEERARGVVVAG